MFGFKVIGKGSFSRVADMGNTVLIESIDDVKNCFANGLMPDSDYLPCIDFAPAKYDIDKVKAGYDVNYYISPKYTRVTVPKKQLRKDEYKIYSELRKVFKSITYKQNKNLNMYCIRDAINDSGLSDDMKELLNECIDSLANYGTDICFEISPRNIATNDKGDLILLDVFFFHSQLKKVYP